MKVTYQRQICSFLIEVTFFCEKTTNFTYFPHRMGSRFDRWFYKEYALHVALSSWWLFVLFSLPLFVPWAVKVFYNVFTSLLLLFIFNQQKVTSEQRYKNSWRNKTLGSFRSCQPAYVCSFARKKIWLPSTEASMFQRNTDLSWNLDSSRSKFC